MAFPTVTLADYLQQVADLLHVSASDSYGYWGQAMLTRFINDAKRHRDLATGGVRSLVSHTLTVGQDVYTLTNITGCERAFDVVSITLVYSAQRILLGQLPFTELQMLYRTWTNFQSRPVKWAKYTPTVIYISPPCATAYTVQLDVASYTADFTATTDTDALPYPFTEPIPYYAAHLAKLNERQYDEANYFKEKWDEHIQEATLAATGSVANYYTMQRLR